MISKFIACVLVLSLFGCATSIKESDMFRYYGKLCIKRTEIKANCYVKDNDIIPTFEITYQDDKWIVSDIFR